MHIYSGKKFCQTNSVSFLDDITNLAAKDDSSMDRYTSASKKLLIQSCCILMKLLIVVLLLSLS